MRRSTMSTGFSPLSLHATVREPLGLLTYFSFELYCSFELYFSVQLSKLPRTDRWSVGNVTVLRCREFDCPTVTVPPTPPVGGTVGGEFIRNELHNGGS
jgi:hypothetical protein